MVSVNVKNQMVNPTGENGKTTKGKAMELENGPSIVIPILASLKTIKDMAMATASGEVEHFIVGNTRKEKKMDLDFICNQMEMYMTENGKKAREKEKESSNGWQQAKSKDAFLITTTSK
jgi:hypothetical protein